MTPIDECDTKENCASARSKLGSSYKTGRQLQEITEIELSRSKIVVLSLDGKPQRIPLVTNH
ncbi:hypothetical protein CW749_19535 [Vibrio sp. vnigr-6D03]|uniref:hypothetical protein n=1 Tax=Vibrio sp. vnigr-6D03 TaxID=2058088 RepID=UPI000C3398FF|nr:hypothetical protein [Vibrio sp. vnigr-6D03]PKF77926.1 hypothetical protein CW749_19535 [Vibrio sp. vnigr-6D03]